MKKLALSSANIAAISTTTFVLTAGLGLAQPLQVSQLPEDPLPNDSFEQSFDEETYRAPSPEDYYNHGQQVGQFTANSGYDYDPLSVCQHLNSEYAQQCIAGYEAGYHTELSGEEISSYYYSQGYQRGTEDVQAGRVYDPHESGSNQLHDETARREWTDGYHSGYWEHVESTDASTE